jgi:hypothetical protein
VLIENPPCQEIVVEGAALNQPGKGVDALPIPISRLRQCTLCVVLDVHLQGSQYRPAEHRRAYVAWPIVSVAG